MDLLPKGSRINKLAKKAQLTFFTKYLAEAVDEHIDELDLQEKS